MKSPLLDPIFLQDGTVEMGAPASILKPTSRNGRRCGVQLEEKQVRRLYGDDGEEEEQWRIFYKQ